MALSFCSLSLVSLSFAISARCFLRPLSPCLLTCLILPPSPSMSLSISSISLLFSYTLVILSVPSSPGLLSFSPYFFLFPLSLRICLHPSLLSLCVHPFLSPSSPSQSEHCLSLSTVKDSPLSSIQRFWRATAGLLLSMHSGHVARQWLISTSISPEMNGSPPRCTRHAF